MSASSSALLAPVAASPAALELLARGYAALTETDSIGGRAVAAAVAAHRRDARVRRVADRRGREQRHRSARPRRLDRRDPRAARRALVERSRDRAERDDVPLDARKLRPGGRFSCRRPVSHEVRNPFRVDDVERARVLAATGSRVRPRVEPLRDAPMCATSVLRCRAKPSGGCGAGSTGSMTTSTSGSPRPTVGTSGVGTTARGGRTTRNLGRLEVRSRRSCGASRTSPTSSPRNATRRGWDWRRSGPTTSRPNPPCRPRSAGSNAPTRSGSAIVDRRL